MAKTLIATEALEVKRAIELIELGARMQVLESETSLSRDKLLRLYKELRGVSPPKGMLPFSADWYMTWMPNIHSTVFYATYASLRNNGKLSHIDAFTRAYRLYLEQTGPHGDEPVLSLTRAWTLVRFFDSDMLQMTACERCTGKFVSYRYALEKGFVCGLCQPPSRAGKTRAAMAEKRKTTQYAGTCESGPETEVLSVAT
jgi:flagellar transcriptional activator FlhC